MKRLFTFFLGLVAGTLMTVMAHSGVSCASPVGGLTRGYTGKVELIFDTYPGDEFYCSDDWYAEMGLLTTASADDEDWKYKPTQALYKWTKQGDESSRFTIDNLYDFFGCPTTEEVTGIAIKFYNSDKSKKPLHYGRPYIVEFKEWQSFICFYTVLSWEKTAGEGWNGGHLFIWDDGWREDYGIEQGVISISKLGYYYGGSPKIIWTPGTKDEDVSFEIVTYRGAVIYTEEEGGTVASNVEIPGGICSDAAGKYTVKNVKMEPMGAGKFKLTWEADKRFQLFQLRIYDSAEKSVKSIVVKDGKQEAEWDLSDLAPGNYTLAIQEQANAGAFFAASQPVAFEILDLSPKNLSITENPERKTVTLQWDADPEVVEYYAYLYCNSITVHSWPIRTEFFAPVDGKYTFECGNLDNMNGKYELHVQAYDISDTQVGKSKCEKNIAMFDNLGEVKVHVLVPTDSDWDITPGLWVCWWKNDEERRKDGRFVKMTDLGNRWYEATLNVDASTFYLALVQGDKWAAKEDDDPICAQLFEMQQSKEIYLDIPSKQSKYVAWFPNVITADAKDHNYTIDSWKVNNADNPGRLKMELVVKQEAPGYKIMYRPKGSSDDYKELVRWHGGTKISVPFDITTNTSYELICYPLDEHDWEVYTTAYGTATVYANPHIPTDLKAEVGKDMKTVTFSWTPSGEEAVSYSLYAYKMYLDNKLLDVSGITENEYTATLMETWYSASWQLSAYNADGEEIARVKGPNFDLGGMEFDPDNMQSRMDGRTLICTWNVAGEWPLCHYALADWGASPIDTIYQTDVQRENGEFRVEYTFDRDTVMNLNWIVYTMDENHERVSSEVSYFYNAIRGSSTEIPAPSKTCHLALSAGIGGYVNTCAIGDYAEGSYAHIIANRLSGWSFKEWSDGNKQYDRYIKMTQDTTLQAIFENYGKFTLSIGTYDKEKGTVNEEVCGDYDAGETVVIEGVPESGYKFSHWTDRSTEVSREIVMDRHYTLWATFEEVNYFTLTVYIEPDEEAGTVTFNGAVVKKNQRSYEEDLTVKLEAIPEDGYEFVAFEEGKVTIDDNIYKVKMTKNHIVTAVFQKVKKDEGLEGIEESDSGIKKILIDGQLYIIRNGKMYDAQGKMIKN